MNTLDWFPAPYQAHGGTSGGGAKRLLGQPSLDPLTVLVRETVQNSWDARQSSAGVMPWYGLNLRTADDQTQSVLRECILAEGMEYAPAGLRQALGSKKLHLIEISDRGTTGLSGPVRADLAPQDHQATNFIDFVFNIGAPRDRHLGGGTYGFGKTITYVVSRASTVVICSCVQIDEVLEVRLIGSAIGAEFTKEGYRYTGHQWWGKSQRGRVEPIRGELAAELARGLKLDVTQPGTTILVLDPDLRGRSLQQAGEFSVSALRWHVWPKMLPALGTDAPPMQFSVMVEGAELTIPPIETDPRLGPFASALQQVRARQAHSPAPEDGDSLPRSLDPIKCGRPKKHLGHLGLTFAAATCAPQRSTADGSNDGKNEDDEEDVRTDACPFSGAPHHVALMRQAELVVTYFEGPPSPVDGFGWAGAFRSLKDVDDHFAMAEPPAHEGWDPEFVRDRHGRTFVRVALRRIREKIRSFTSLSLPEEARGTGLPTAHIGDLLGGIIPSVRGNAPSPNSSRRPSGPGERSRKRKSGNVEIIGTRLEKRPSGTRVEMDLRISGFNGDPVLLHADVGVRTDTGREVSPPRGVAPPSLGKLQSKDGRHLDPHEDGYYHLPEKSGEKWTLLIHHAEPAALDVRVEAEPDVPDGEE